MDVYFIRHGESEANRDGAHSGWSPAPLTDAGLKQAEAARALLEKVEFDRVYVSDVLRAQQTARALFPNAAYIYTALARELNNTAMKGLNKQQMVEKFGDAYLACREAFDYAPLGLNCESRAHLFARAEEFLKTLNRVSGAKRIAVVSHAGFIIAFAARVLKADLGPRALKCDNASISVFRLDERGWRVCAWNITPAPFRDDITKSP